LFLLLLLFLFVLQGITREGKHKRRETGGRRAKFQKKRKYEMGRPPSMTKIGEARIHQVRGRGGNLKLRALRLDSGNFSWGTEVCTRKVRVLDVTYNASNNELVRTKTLVKGAIVLIDAHPFKAWYEGHYGVKIGLKKSATSSSGGGDDPAATTTNQPSIDLTTVSEKIASKFKKRQSDRTLESALDHQFASGRLYAKITSRPGQTGRCDGYVLEGKELAFYQRMMHKK
jgi:small subunit ribosomal protein S8e